MTASRNRDRSMTLALRKDSPHLVLPASCPPEILVRGNVLNPSEAIDAHLSRCPRCMDVYRAARCAELPGPRWRH